MADDLEVTQSELLRAAKEALPFVNRIYNPQFKNDDGGEQIRERLRQAIAKAEGENR